MDKVDLTAASLISSSLGLKPETKKTRGKNEASASRKALFTKMLESSSNQNLGPLLELDPSEEALTELMDAVHSTGSDLIERPFANEILNYKKAVRNFVHYVVENAFTIEKHHVRRKDKIHVQVMVIDKKLEELAAAILSGQTNQLTRVSKLDELKGLLVDLTVTGVIKVRDD